jgi:hypothetical protein
MGNLKVRALMIAVNTFSKISHSAAVIEALKVLEHEPNR